MIMQQTGSYNPDVPSAELEVNMGSLKLRVGGQLYFLFLPTLVGSLVLATLSEALTTMRHIGITVGGFWGNRT